MAKYVRDIKLYGGLAEEFGEVFHNMYAPAFVDAINLLEANFPGHFLSKIRDGSYYIVRGDSLDDATPLVDGCELVNKTSYGAYHIIPATAGAKSSSSKGIFQIIGGVALVALAFTGVGAIMGPQLAGMGAKAGATIDGASKALISSSAWGSTAFLGMSYTTVALMGTAFVLGGIANLISPTPSDTLGDLDNTDSFGFGGPKNTSAEGSPVPIIYGELEAGSLLVSSAVDTEDYAPQFTGTNIFGNFGYGGGYYN